MAIAFDTETDGGSSGATSLTWSHTCSGSNRLLFVATLQAVEGTDDITSMTYGGVSMTRVAGIQSPGDRFIGLWYVIAPASGANNVVVNFTGNFMNGYSMSYTGCKQSSQPDSSNSTTTGTSTTFSISTTVVASNCWVIAHANNINRNSTVGASTTNRAPATPNTQSDTVGDSNGAVGTGSQTLNFTAAAGAGSWGGIIASFSPITAAATALPFKSLLGVGI